MSESKIAGFLDEIVGSGKKRSPKARKRPVWLHTPEMKRKAKAAKAASLQGYANFLSDMQNQKRTIGQANANIRNLPIKQRRKAAKSQLYGGSPLKDLLYLQQSTLSPKIYNKKRIDPAVAVQLYAMSQGGIKNATRCAAAVEAARRASRTKYSPNLRRTTGPGLTPARANALLAAYAANIENGRTPGIREGAKKALATFQSNH